jgi:hypothetical protein
MHKALTVRKGAKCAGLGMDGALLTNSFLPVAIRNCLHLHFRPTKRPDLHRPSVKCRTMVHISYFKMSIWSQIIAGECKCEWIYFGET